MSDEGCKYCGKPRDKWVGGAVGRSGIPLQVEVARVGELDFENPPNYEKSELCRDCIDSERKAGNKAMTAMSSVKSKDVVNVWRKDLRDLEAKKAEPHGLAALHGYQDKVRRMIREAKR